MSTPAAYDQTSARFRKDDGSETTATWHAAEDANLTLSTRDGNKLRYRAHIIETAGGTETGVGFELRYQKNGTGGYVLIGSAGSTTLPIKARATSGYVDQDDTTEQLTNQGGTFDTSNKGCSETLATGTNNITANAEWEVEFSVELYEPQITDGDYFDFRVYKVGGTALDSYAAGATIRCTAKIPTFEQVAFRLATTSASRKWIYAQGVDPWITDSDYQCTLKLLLQNSTAYVADNQQWRLAYSVNSGTWTQITTTSSYVRFATFGTDGGDTTSELTGGSGSFVSNNNQVHEGGGSNLTTAYSHTASDKTELEIGLHFQSVDMAVGDAIDIRIEESDGTAITTYTDTPRFTVVDLHRPIEQLAFRGRSRSGTESTGAWLAALNTDFQMVEDYGFRTRFTFNTKTEGDTSTDLILLYKHNAGAWTVVGNQDGTSKVTTINGVLTQGGDTTDQLSGDGADGSFITNNNAQSEIPDHDAFNSTSGDHYEAEWVLRINDGTGLANNDTIQLKARSNNASTLDLWNYAQIPTITVKFWNMEQKVFRFADDTASRTWKAAQNTNISLSAADTNKHRLKVGIQEKNGVSTEGWDGGFEYSHNSGTWTKVNNTTSVIRTVTSTHVTDGDDCTSELTTLTGTFHSDNNQVYAGDGDSNTTNGMTANGNFEAELVFQLQTADITSGDTIDLRYFYSGGKGTTNAPISWTVTPRITITGGTAVDAVAEGTIEVVGSVATGPVGVAIVADGFAELVGSVSNLADTGVDVDADGVVEFVGSGTVGVGTNNPSVGVIEIVGEADANIGISPVERTPDYKRLFIDLLPEGFAWLFADDDPLILLICGIITEVSRIEGRTRDLLKEMDPRTSLELLSELEETWGLPGKCNTNPPTTIGGRRLALHAKMKGKGNVGNRIFLLSAAATMGYPNAVIYTFSSHFFVATSECTDALYSEIWDSAFIFLPNDTTENDDALFCLIRSYIQVHETVLFELPEDFTP